MRPGKPLMHGRLGAMRVPWLAWQSDPRRLVLLDPCSCAPLLRAFARRAGAGRRSQPSPARLAVDLARERSFGQGLYARVAEPQTPREFLSPSRVTAQDSSLVEDDGRAPTAWFVRPRTAEAAKAGDSCRVISVSGARGFRAPNEDSCRPGDPEDFFSGHQG